MRHSSGIIECLRPPGNVRIGDDRLSQGQAQCTRVWVRGTKRRYLARTDLVILIAEHFEVRKAQIDQGRSVWALEISAHQGLIY